MNRPAAGGVQILPDHVANQIAAGEVVERPASVVKELAENAVDAGARRVEVALRNGGKTEIRVSDDGSGMNREDAVLALDRHATSKIRSVDDLRSVRSFGFRGEALPSIAAVSRFELHTALSPEEGVRARVDFGRIRSVDDVPRRRGTTVTVRALFHDLPARAKFLRSSAAETRAAGEALVLLALANPAVGFRLESNRRASMDLSPARDWLGRIGQLWADLAPTLIPVEDADGPVRVRGFIQRPDAARARGGRRYTFVNGRPFRDAALLQLVDDAFRTTVVEGLRPSLFLRIETPPAGVDVNVHPAKAEVRFRDRESVETAVGDAVRAALARLDSTKPVGIPGAAPDAEPGHRTPSRGRAAKPRPEPAAEMPQFALFVSGRDDARGADEPGGVTGASGQGDAEVPFAGPELWQLHDRYILAATREGLLIVDQHSAHERVLYEEIMARFETGGGTSQALLFPVTLQFSPPEAEALEDLAGLLARQGFELEPFGERTWILTAAPQPHSRFDAERCLREMVRELAEGSPLVDTARNQHERLAKSMACKGAIKAGEPIAPEEARELFDRLFATPLPGHDVHGRPTIVRLSVEELDRRFGRG
ncbi:MAG: DNA mismatch repair endonuclease MutL [Gemmatimonadetes bacterium]|nr:DNA mismatch repair endonuclease MutL [Candidatus Palauibacter rhopaloidicola]